jgi:CheY-like chemotaxis protein
METSLKDHIEFLLVGTDREQLDQIATILDEAGHSAVRIVRSAIQARNFLKTCKVEVVITDFDMPGMNGIELLKLIRRLPELLTTPVLVLLSNAEHGKLQYALDERADACLEKPITEEKLLANLYKIRQRRESISPLQKQILVLRKLQLLGKYDQTIKLAREILTENENPEVYYLLSKCYYFMQDYERARQFLKKLMERPPNSKTLHLLSKVCRAENQCGDALVHLTKANDNNPANLDLRIDLGKLYLAMDMRDEADKIFEEMQVAELSDLSLIKIGKAYLKHGDPEKAGAYLNRSIDPIPETAYIFKNYAENLASQGHFAESLKQYEKCLRIIPDNATFLLGIAQMQIKLNQKEEAVQRSGIFSIFIQNRSKLERFWKSSTAAAAESLIPF